MSWTYVVATYYIHIYIKQWYILEASKVWRCGGELHQQNQRDDILLPLDISDHTPTYLYNYREKRYRGEIST